MIDSLQTISIHTPLFAPGHALPILIILTQQQLDPEEENSAEYKKAVRVIENNSVLTEKVVNELLELKNKMTTNEKEVISLAMDEFIVKKYKENQQ